jgi:hypothetical protein
MKLRMVNSLTPASNDHVLGEPEVHEHAAKAIQKPAHLPDSVGLDKGD